MSARGTRSTTGAVLHVAAMPFPTAQGTQAAVHRMVEATAKAGGEAHLLTYGRGAFERHANYALHRLPDLPGREAFRSGPSLRKIVLDVALPFAIRRLNAQLSPRAVVAHHVEAALGCIAAGVPFLFVAHTSLSAELPTYLPSSVAAPIARAGRTLDAFLVRRAERCLAVSPSLAARLARESGRGVHDAPIPWSVHAPFGPGERAAARANLRIDAGAAVALYAGNLDAYQGWETALEAVTFARRSQPTLRALFLTNSDTAPLTRLARQLGVADALILAPNTGGAARRRAHAASDLALIPRRSEGGFPVKMLEAFAHGVPAVVEHRAQAGLDLTQVTMVVPNEHPTAFAVGITRVLEGTGVGKALAETLAAAGRAYVHTHHSGERFLRALFPTSALPSREGPPPRDAETP
jgi:glycosyltransferase involved in cell wall biosynthesis